MSKYISSSGILPFDYVTTTDHRALFVDIYLNRYLKTPNQEYQDPQTRRLQSTFTKGVKSIKRTYLTILNKKNYEGNTIMQKKLKDKSLTLQDMTHINNIDEKMITGMIKVGKKLNQEVNFSLGIQHL